MTKTVTGSRDLAVKTLFAIFALGGPSMAALATEADIPQKAVHYSDLDLTHESGAKVLYRRISSAARRVCSNLDRSDLASKTRLNSCIQRAVQDAVIAVDQPTLLAVYQGKHRRSEALSIASLSDGQTPSARAP